MNRFVRCFVTWDLHSLGKLDQFLQWKFPFSNHRSSNISRIVRIYLSA